MQIFVFVLFLGLISVSLLEVVNIETTLSISPKVVSFDDSGFIITSIIANDTFTSEYKRYHEYFSFSEHNANGKVISIGQHSDLYGMEQYSVSKGFMENGKKTFFLCAIYMKLLSEVYYDRKPRILRIIKVQSDGNDVNADTIHSEYSEGENFFRSDIEVVGNDENESKIAVVWESFNSTTDEYQLQSLYMTISTDNNQVTSKEIFDEVNNSVEQNFPFYPKVASTQDQILFIHSTTGNDNLIIQGNLFTIENGKPKWNYWLPQNLHGEIQLENEWNEIRISLKGKGSLFACMISVDSVVGAYGFTYDLKEKRIQYINNGFKQYSTSYPMLNDGMNADIEILDDENKDLAIFYLTITGDVFYGRCSVRTLFLTIENDEDIYINSTSLKDYGEAFSKDHGTDENFYDQSFSYLPNGGFIYIWEVGVADSNSVVRGKLQMVESNCEIGTYLDTSELICESCSDRKSTVSFGSIGIESCFCAKGYYLDVANVESCQPCLQNTYKDVASDDSSCTACPLDTKFEAYGATDLLNCTTNSETNGDDTAAIIIGILSGVFGMVLFVVILFFLIAFTIFLIMYNKSRKKANRFDHIEGVDLILQEAEVEQNSQNTNVVPKIEVQQSKHIIDFKDIKILTKIGQGGSNSTVYKADWKGTICAFKAFSPASTIVSDLNNHQNKYEEFEKEVSFCVGLNHPSILQFYGASVTPSRVGLVIQYCANGDLKSFLNKYTIGHENQKYPKKEKLRIIKQITLGLEYLHSKKLIHRDMKPENVLVDEHENSKIMDFGLSKTMDDAAEKTQTKRVGTIFYMAPEVIRGGNYSFPCDVFSWAITVYVIITENFYPYGNHTYESTVMKKVVEDSSFRPQMNESDFKDYKFLVPVIQKCWDVEPDERYTFSELKEFLIHEEENSKD